jgi:hypothetical protein
MTTAYATTSVPGWAVAGSRSDVAPPDPSARSWILVALAGGVGAMRGWAGASVSRDAVTITEATPEKVRRRLAAAVEAARVGVRVAVAGPAGDCLLVRGQLLSAGLEDDEITILPTGAGEIEVYCAHCRNVTRAAVAIGDVTPCAHCGLGLHVYHHVSRETGRYLGFQADAERLPDGFEA